MSVLGYDFIIDADPFPVFVYNSADYDFLEFNSNVCVMNNAYVPVIHDAIVDFVKGYSLDAYDNYDGRCVVSCKAMPVGSDGPFLLFFGGDDWFFIPGWQVIMTQDEYDYYFSVSGIF